MDTPTDDRPHHQSRSDHDTPKGGSDTRPRGPRTTPRPSTVSAVKKMRALLKDTQSPPVLAVGNQKGGVGKSTTVLGLAEAAIDAGLTVAVVDLDPQCNLTEILDPPDADAAGTRDLLRDDSAATLAECLTPASADWPGVLICAADLMLSNREYDLGAAGAEDKLAAAITSDAGPVDLILLDLPPARSRLALAGLVAANGLLVPTTATTNSARRVDDLLSDFLPRARKYNPDVAVIGVLVTKWANRVEERRVLRELQAVYGDQLLDRPIPRHEIVSSGYEGLHLRLRSMHDPYATAVADAYAEHLPTIITTMTAAMKENHA